MTTPTVVETLWLGWWRPRPGVRYTRLVEGPTYGVALERLLEALANERGGDTVVLRGGVNPDARTRPDDLAAVRRRL